MAGKSDMMKNSGGFGDIKESAATSIEDDDKALSSDPCSAVENNSDSDSGNLEDARVPLSFDVESRNFLLAEKRGDLPQGEVPIIPAGLSGSIIPCPDELINRAFKLSDYLRDCSFDVDRLRKYVDGNISIREKRARKLVRVLEYLEEACRDTGIAISRRFVQPYIHPDVTRQELTILPSRGLIVLMCEKPRVLFLNRVEIELVSLNKVLDRFFGEKGEGEGFGGGVMCKQEKDDLLGERLQADIRIIAGRLLFLLAILELHPTVEDLLGSRSETTTISESPIPMRTSIEARKLMLREVDDIKEELVDCGVVMPMIRIGGGSTQAQANFLTRLFRAGTTAYYVTNTQFPLRSIAVVPLKMVDFIRAPKKCFRKMEKTLFSPTKSLEHYILDCWRSIDRTPYPFAFRLWGKIAHSVATCLTFTMNVENFDPVECNLIWKGRVPAAPGAAPGAAVRTPVIIHFHGGGFISMSPRSHELYVRDWARKTEFPVFSVNYRWSPEHLWPAAVLDCYASYLWVLNNAKSEFGIIPEQVILAGDSAGGNLICTTTILAIMNNIRIPDRLIGLYPALNLTSHLTESRLFSLEDAVMNGNVLLMIMKHYARDQSRMWHPLISPLFVEGDVLRRFPETYFFVGNLDPLRDDSILFAYRLCQLGVTAKVTILQEFTHGYIAFCDLLPACRAINNMVMKAMMKEFPKCLAAGFDCTLILDSSCDEENELETREE